MNVVAYYFVPRSQVWEGSRGGQSGRVHLRHEHEGRTFCGRPRGWYERPADDTDPRCDRCAKVAERLGLEWPDSALTSAPGLENVAPLEATERR